MNLSKETIAAIVDLIENKLAMMHIADCDDLRERMTMQRALAELRGTSSLAEAGMLKDFGDIPRRGRRRKVSTMLGERGDDEHRHPIHRD